MTQSSVRRIQGSLVFLLALLSTAQSSARRGAAEEAFRPPAVPLISCDPYFSIWSQADHLYDHETTHWTGKPHHLTALLRVDGKSFRLMGGASDPLAVIKQTSVEVFPTRTVYRFDRPKVNPRDPLRGLDPLKLFDHDPFKPKLPRGWTKVIAQTPATQAARPPIGSRR